MHATDTWIENHLRAVISDRINGTEPVNRQVKEMVFETWRRIRIALDSGKD